MDGRNGWEGLMEGNWRGEELMEQGWMGGIDGGELERGGTDGGGGRGLGGRVLGLIAVCCIVLMISLSGVPVITSLLSLHSSFVIQLFHGCVAVLICHCLVHSFFGCHVTVSDVAPGIDVS